MLSRKIQDQFGIEDGPVRKVREKNLVVTKEQDRERQPSDSDTPRKRSRSSHLAAVIRKAVQSETFVRMQKNLILIKVLSDSTSRARVHASNPSKSSKLALAQAIQQAKASVRMISKIFTPLVFRLYPEHIETIMQYTEDAAEAGAAKRRRLPFTLLNDIELPRVQMDLEGIDRNSREKRDSFENESDREQSEKKKIRSLQSREYYLLLSSIYLSETFEQIEKTFGEDIEVQKLAKLVRPEISALENACSKIYKICYKNLPARPRKWKWSSDFRAAF